MLIHPYFAKYVESEETKLVCITLNRPNNLNKTN
jgi:hypothetical protein